ncbi:MAG TPA: elongation factor G [Bacteroidetes bacterium]|nr:elongation factor G [Bacteroidota bacterium]
MGLKTENIRNIVLLGHSGSGKTSLTEAMLFEAKELNRIGTIENKTTTSDFTNIEKEKGNSIFSTLMHAKWKDSKINIIDTPGLDDFVGEVISSLKVADTAAITLNSTSGVEVGTELVWEYIEKFETPAFFIINHMDHDKSDYEKTLEQAQSRFGNKVIPLQFPYNEGTGFNKIVDALRMVMYVFPEGGGKPEKQPIPDDVMEKAQEMHNTIVETAAEEDETLMEKFFDEGSLTEEELAEGLKKAIINQDFFPLFITSAKENMGTGRIMGFINDIAPSPADRPPAKLEGGGELECKMDGPSVMFIFKTMSEPQVGLVSYFKVYSGVIKTGQDLINQENRTVERLNQLFVSNGKTRENVDEVIAGDIGVTVKLKNSHTNNTLTEKGVDYKIEKIHFPEPRVREAIIPPGKAEMEKLMKSLHQIAEEDPTLLIEQNSTLKQTIIHGQGQLHLDIISYRIEKTQGISMELTKPKVPYRETITKMSQGSYRHKKQTGGAGQFAEVHMRIEPYTEGMPNPSDLTVRNTEEEDLPWGGKLSFLWCIVGGSIDKNYSSAIKKGILQKMEEGPLTGSNVQDIRVSVYDGKMHPVDSSDMAFMIASSYLFKDIFTQAAPKLLEPIYEVEILTPEESMGDIMSDLQTRRAIIQGMDSEGHYQKIIAKVPLAELYRYSSTLRSLSQGRAKFSRKFSEYSPVPHELQQSLINEYKAQEQED